MKVVRVDLTSLQSGTYKREGKSKRQGGKKRHKGQLGIKENCRGEEEVKTDHKKREL